jgi:hypothetical protein
VATSTCVGTCGASTIIDTDALNTELLTGYTDVNDPNNINGELRTVTDAIQKEAFNNGISGKGKGKKSIRVYHTTDLILQCGAATPQKIRLQVTNDVQG